jgi:hypothetical protein
MNDALPHPDIILGRVHRLYAVQRSRVNSFTDPGREESTPATAFMHSEAIP